MTKEKRPKVGTAVIVLKDDKVLLGKRKGSHASGTWNFPGGHLEFGESVEACAKRETKEEAGIEIKNVKTGPYTNDIFDEGKHYITLHFIAEYDSGEVRVMEPDKCDEWGWFDWYNLPQPLMLGIENLLKNNYSPFKEN
jgi:8-oxo-dGTP diphosphatase